MNKELIVNNQAALALPELFQDFDFKDLNKSIETLATASKDLSEKEKELGVQIVEDWEHKVIERLAEHGTELDGFINYLDPNESRQYYHRDFVLDKDQMIALAGKTDTVAVLQTYFDAKEACEQHERTKPMSGDLADDTTLTYEERIIIQKDNEKEKALWDLKMKRLERAKDMALYSWKKALQQVKEIQDMISYARQYRRNVNKYKKECQDKSQAARLNISIATPEARAALKELLDFATKLS